MFGLLSFAVVFPTIIICRVNGNLWPLNTDDDDDDHGDVMMTMMMAMLRQAGKADPL